MFNAVNLENVLVDQKNELIRAVNSASTVTDFTSVIRSLRLLSPFWTIAGYQYKEQELTVRILSSLEFIIDNRTDEYHSTPKNERNARDRIRQDREQLENVANKLRNNCTI